MSTTSHFSIIWLRADGFWTDYLGGANEWATEPEAQSAIPALQRDGVISSDWKIVSAADLCNYDLVC
jgi:hypothetical protein